MPFPRLTFTSKCLKRCCSSLTLVVLLIFQGAGSPIQAGENRPNLILIIADDMGWDDCGAYGHPKIRTPNIDRLSKKGMRFDRAFLTTSSCSPSRSSIITSRYPHNTEAGELHVPLPATQVTFPELLRKAGYYTAAAGKWHLGPATKAKFDTVKEGGRPSGCEHWVSLLRDRPQDKPFFLWLASFDPHRPYEPNSIEQPHTAADVVIPPFIPDTPKIRDDFARYYDEIHRLDHYVGLILDELDRQKVSQNTLVIFISDNGRPFPRCKTTLYDSGIRTPFLACWPARIRPGSVCGSLISSIDIAPTFLELAGIAPPSSFQGRSFAQVLTRPTATIRDYAFAEHNWHDFDDHQRAVRGPRFLYIENNYTDIPLTPPCDVIRSDTFQDMRRLHAAGTLTLAQQRPFLKPRPPEELYDTDADPHQLNNLADDPAHAETLQNLRKVLAEWKRSTGDAVPSKRRADEYHRDTGERLSTKPKVGNK